MRAAGTASCAVPLALCVVFSGLGCTRSTPTAPPVPAPGSIDAPPIAELAWFVDDAIAAGLDFRHVTGADPSKRLFLPEIVCGGVALLDYDDDADLDIYFVQGGRIGNAPGDQPPNRLYRNRGDGTFEDVTAESGAGARGYGMGCAANDIDGDGDIDLYISNADANVLLVNNGDGTFTELPDAGGATDPELSGSAAFFDFDRDDDLDLVVVDYVGWSADSELSCYSAQGNPDYCQPNNYQSPTADHLFRNEGGRFVEISTEVGLDGVFGHGLGVVTGDFDGDHRLDFFVANDGTNNHHWFQTPDGTFEERALLRGTAVNQAGRVEAGMGVATLDVDGDLDLDLFLTHLRNESNTLYLREEGYYEDATDRFGLGGSSLPHTGFGLGFADFDLDGDLDLYIANGSVMQTAESRGRHDPYAEPNLLYAFDAGRFRSVNSSGETEQRTSRGCAFGDVDNDGDIDIVVVNRDGPATLLRNRFAADRDRHWILLDVREASGAPAQHARVRLAAGGRDQTRIVDPHSSYGSSNDPRLHFGLGSVTVIDEIEITWFDGTSETVGPLEVDRIHRIRRGEE